MLIDWTRVKEGKCVFVCLLFGRERERRERASEKVNWLFVPSLRFNQTQRIASSR